MSSNDHPKDLDLARGLPTTESDVAALRAMRYPQMTDAEYCQFLLSLTPPTTEALAAKRGPRGEPFRLPTP